MDDERAVHAGLTMEAVEVGTGLGVMTDLAGEPDRWWFVGQGTIILGIEDGDVFGTMFGTQDDDGGNRYYRVTFRLPGSLTSSITITVCSSIPDHPLTKNPIAFLMHCVSKVPEMLKRAKPLTDI